MKIKKIMKIKNYNIYCIIFSIISFIMISLFSIQININKRSYEKKQIVDNRTIRISVICSDEINHILDNIDNIDYYNVLECMDNYKEYIVVIDDFNNINKVLRELAHQNIFGDILNHNANEEIKSEQIIINILKVIIILVNLIILCLIIKFINEIVKEELYNIALLKILGFNNIKIVLWFLFIVINIYLISFIISSFFYFLITFIKFFNDFINRKYMFESILYSNVLLLLCLFISILFTYFKIKNVNVKSLYKV